MTLEEFDQKMREAYGFSDHREICEDLRADLVERDEARASLDEIVRAMLALPIPLSLRKTIRQKMADEHPWWKERDG